ncbi:unnamed protein product [Rotaria magnacalcarata]|uniref:Uncharacterized protein n=1 Tax=Rotaria magnacalcarata TaxID=392030 RepID=A0A814XQQ4_9BILA|nr:unnamed protein product [Rotaria magnacalcarata]CAF1219132.1 unnamed protein product [Rotaria magnacalcarata]CAF1917675.1 unnamed protein product [Rotaria magnacalcarata]CAF3768132.1 unnamed protein product [Rotaria magnacalcarata]CAF3819334.1 unnamed protein product [Rotaria magnacalcarata]
MIQWKKDDANGKIVAGGKGGGNRLDQLNYPTDVLIDKQTDSFIICNRSNRRVVRWSRRTGTAQGEILIDYIQYLCLAMDEEGYLYISDVGKDEVRRYQSGDNTGTLVAGCNGNGSGFNKLHYRTHLFVD